VRFEVFTAVEMSVLFFWFLTPCGLSRSPEDGDYVSPKMLVSTCKSTWHHNPENNNTDI
jgi:hypothetical protein